MTPLGLRYGHGLEDPRGHLVKVLALALDDKVLALAPQVLALALREKSCQDQGQHSPQDPGHVDAVRACSAHTHMTVFTFMRCSRGSSRPRPASRTTRMPIRTVHSAYSSCSEHYTYLCSLCLSLERTNSISVGLLMCSQSPLGLLDFVNLHNTHSVIHVCHHSRVLCLVI